MVGPDKPMELYVNDSHRSFQLLNIISLFILHLLLAGVSSLWACGFLASGKEATNYKYTSWTIRQTPGSPDGNLVASD